MAEVAHGGHHGPGKRLGVHRTAPVSLVAHVEARLRGPLVGEDLDDLLPLDHLLNITVDNPQIPLLGGEIAPGTPAYGHDHHHHEPHGEHAHQKQRRTEIEHHRHHTDEGQTAGDEADHAVVEDLGNGLDVVGIAAHELTVGVGVKIAQRQALHLGKEVLPDGVGRPLGDMDHDAGIRVAEKRRADVNARKHRQHPCQTGVVPRNDAVVNEGPEHIAAADGTAHVQHQTHRHHPQEPLGFAHIAQ